MPGNVLSNPTESAAFLAPRDTDKTNPLVDLTLGGLNFDDPSQGMRVKTWTASVDGAGNVTVSAPGVTPQVIITVAGITWIGLAFDTNMRLFLAYIVAGTCFYRWFDTSAGQYVTTALPASSDRPFCQLDDARPLETSKCDILLTYQRTQHLYVRMQRDRYAVEYDLGSIGPLSITQTGMNRGNRFQFELNSLGG